MKHRSLWLILGALLLAGGLALALWPRPPVLVLRGLVQAREVKNASRLGGRVLTVSVTEGQTVHTGQTLVTFDAKDGAAQVAEAEAALAQAEARAHQVTEDAPPEDFKQAQAQLVQAQQALKLLQNGARAEERTQAEARVSEMQTRLDRANAAVENTQTLAASGVVSAQRLADVQAEAAAARSGLAAAQSTLQTLKAGARPEQVAQARAQVSAAQAQIDRLRRGARAGEREAALAQVAQARAALARVKAQQAEAAVRAPMDGVASVVSVSPGELVPAGRPIVTVIDLNHPWTELAVPESQLSRLRLGQELPVTATVFPNAQFTGTVQFISPKSDFVPNGGSDGGDEPTFRVKVALSARDRANQHQLLPGMRVKVGIPD